MRNLLIVTMGALALGLSGCGDGGGSSDGGGSGDGVSGSERNRFVQTCLNETNMEQPICECLADTARDELTAGSFEMLLASIEGDDARATQLRSELTMEELTASGMFMVNTPGRCAAQAGG